MLNPERFLTVRFMFEWYPETSRSLYSYIRIREVGMFSRLYWYDQFIIFHLHHCPLRRNKNNKPNSSQIPHSNCTTSARITPVVLPAHWVRDGFGIPAEGGWQGVSLVSLGIAIASRSAAKTRQSKELNLCYAEIECFTQWSDCVFAFRCMFVWGKYVIPSWGATKLCTYPRLLWWTRTFYKERWREMTKRSRRGLQNR